MLKLFYKTLLIGLLSSSLMIMDFNSKGLMIQSAQAESLKTEGVKKEDGNLMATLTMTAIGVLTSRLWSCTKTVDMIVAGAGGAAFVGGEILSTIKLRKAMKDMETQINRDAAGNINDEQIKALERLKQSYIEAKKTAGTKKTLQQAAAAAFLAAAALAYSLDAAEKAVFATCKAALATEGATCVGLAPAAGSTATLLVNLETQRWLPQPSAAAKALETANLTSTTAGQSATSANAGTLAIGYKATCATPGGQAACPIAAKCALAPAALEAACKPIIPTLSANSGFCPIPLSLGASIPGPSSNYAFTSKNPLIFLSSLLGSKLTSESRADLFSPLGIASGAAISYLLATSATLGVTIDSYLLSAMNRAIIWGVLAGLTYMATTATDNVIAKIEMNISKIDGILNEMNSSLGKGTETSNPKQPLINKPAVKITNKFAGTAVKYETVDLKENGGGALPCYTGKDPSKCTPFSDEVKNVNGFGTLDLESQKQITSILKTADGLNGTSKITSGTLEGAAQLANSANALGAAHDQAKKNAIESLRNSGSKIDLNEEAKKFSEAIGKNVRDGLKKSNTTASGMLASIYGSSIPSSTDTAVATKKEEVSGSQASPNFPLIDVQGVGATAGINAGLSGLAIDSSEKEEPTNLEDKSAQALNDFELKNTDITTDTGSSIFELISHRYKQSGYPRLFKLKEPPTETQPVKK